MSEIILNTRSVPQTVSHARVVVNGTGLTYPVFPGATPKVIRVGRYSFVVTTLVDTELKCTLQSNTNGGGWVDVLNQVAVMKLKADAQLRYGIRYHVPYYTGLPAGTKIRYQVVAECPTGSVILHQADGVDCTPSGIWKQKFDFDGNSPSNPGTIDDAFFPEFINDPAGTGDIWGESNSNTHFLSISGDRFVWVGRRETNIAQSVVGTIDGSGDVSFGVLSEDSFSGPTFSSNTYGVVSIGNNKFARFHTDIGMGFMVWDCGDTGQTATLMATNDNLCTHLPSGWKNAVLFSNGRISLLTSRISGNPDKNLLMVYDVDSISGVISNEQQVPSAFFGDDRNGCWPAAIDGCKAPDGVLYVARTADSSDATSNPKMEFIYCNTSTLSLERVQCEDLDGYPTAVTCQSDGVFVAAYLTIDNKIRFICGKINDGNIYFGASFDYQDGAVGMSQFSMSGLSVGDGKFAISYLDDNINTQSIIPISTDGTNIYSAAPFGNHGLRSSGDDPVDIIPISDNRVAVGCYGRPGGSFPILGSRYVTTFELIDVDCVSLVSGVSAHTDIVQGKWVFFKIYANVSDTALVVSLTNLTANADLYVKKGRLPTYDIIDSSSFESGTTPEECNVVNSGEGWWYIGVDRQDSAAECDVIAILS